MSWWDYTLRIWRVFILGIGGFDIGFALMICWMFMTGKFQNGVYGTPRHVIFITVSYVLLALALWAAIFGKALEGTDVTWRLPLATVAFPLGIIALYRLLKRAK
jgi:uncharacterized membrane protein